MFVGNAAYVGRAIRAHTAVNVFKHQILVPDINAKHQKVIGWENIAINVSNL